MFCVHVLRRQEEYIGNIVMEMEVPGKEKEEDRSGCRWTTSRTMYRLIGDRIVKGSSAIPSLTEASHKKHPPRIQVGKDAEEEQVHCRSVPPLPWG